MLQPHKIPPLPYLPWPRGVSNKPVNTNRNISFIVRSNLNISILRLVLVFGFLSLSTIIDPRRIEVLGYSINSIYVMYPLGFLFLFLLFPNQIFGSNRTKIFNNIRVGWKYAVAIVIISILWELIFNGLSNFNQTILLIGNQLFIIKVILIFLVGLTEELLYRRVLLIELLNKTKSPFLALLISGVAFGLVHVPIYLHDGLELNELLSAISSTSLFGIAIGYIYYKTQSLLVVTSIHALIDYRHIVNMNLEVESGMGHISIFILLILPIVLLYKSINWPVANNG